MTTPFDAALSDLRIRASVLLHERYSPPWAVDVPAQATLRAALAAPDDALIVPFHLVRAGGFELRYDGAEARPIALGEVAICASGAPHRMSEGRADIVVPLSQLLTGTPAPWSTDPATARTELICGAFQLRASPLNPLLAALPRVLTVQASGPGAPALLGHAAEMLALEVARGRDGFVAARLLEVFLAEALRAYSVSREALAGGWFRAIADPRIGQALAGFHRQPDAPWSVARLADGAAMSASRFAARFREAMGMGPMAYVARWRMAVACQRLREGEESLETIADAVGYRDATAFSRAFKTRIGASPARWRARQAGIGA